MRATIDIIRRFGPIVVLSVFAAFLGCSGEVEDRSSVTPHLQHGVMEGVTKLLEGERGVEAGNDTVSTEAIEKEGRRVETEEAAGHESSLIYTREYYSYRVRKKKDPFLPLLTEGGQLEGLTLNELVLTGILWGEGQSLAVMEDSQGKGFLLKVGDEIAGARLVAIRQDAAVFRVVEFGVVHNIEKELIVKEERPL